VCRGTPHASLQATRARCPIPGLDFHPLVPAYRRHTVRYHSLWDTTMSVLRQEGSNHLATGITPPLTPSTSWQYVSIHLIDDKGPSDGRPFSPIAQGTLEVSTEAS
jgi:hypothetical protein